MKDTGGSAFPHIRKATMGEQQAASARRETLLTVEESGITLRDYFAAKALPSCILQCNEDYKDGLTFADYFAKKSYEIADAMIKARK
jgi:hypothetical protein